MTSRRALDHVIADYRAAHTRTKDLAHLLEGIPIFTRLDTTGQEFMRDARQLTEQATALGVDIHRMAERLQEVISDD